MVIELRAAVNRRVSGACEGKFCEVVTSLRCAQQSVAVVAGMGWLHPLDGEATLAASATRQIRGGEKTVRFASDGAALLANQVVTGRELRMLRRVTGDSEEVEFVARGKDANSGARVLAVCTDLRFIQLRRRLFSIRATDWNYDGLRRPTYAVARGVGTVRADGKNGGVHVGGLTEESARNLYNALEAHLPDESALRRV